MVGAPGPVERLSVHGDDRRALRLDTPKSVRFRVHVAEGDVLSFGFVVRPPEARVRLRLRNGDRERALYEEEVRELRPWSDRRVDLSSLAGREVELVLEVSGDLGSIAIAEPQVLSLAPERPSAIVYVVDCLRADRVGAYGYARPTTPSIDRLAQSAHLFENAFACASWTKPGVGCLLTGLTPPSHGARTVDDALDPARPTLAERLRGEGYSTAAWIANPVLDGRGFGYARGFDRYVELAQKWKGHAVNQAPGDAAQITEAVIPWLEANRDSAFFIYLHSLDLHYPYAERPGFEALVRGGREGLERDSDLYDSELAYNDREIGRLLDALARLGLEARTLVVVTADHGEAFGEHGSTRHGHTLFDELLHIPLVIRPPRGLSAPSRVKEAVGQIDLAPTMLELVGAPAAQGLEGLSLRPAMEQWPLGRRRLFAEQISPAETLYAVREGRWKRVDQLLPQPSSLLFDWKADPRELRNLISEHPGDAERLEAALLPFMQSGQEGRHLVLADPPPGGPARVVIEAEGRIAQLVRLVVRTGDTLALAGDRRSAVLSLAPAGRPREFVIRSEPAEAPLRIRHFEGGRLLPGAALRVGSRPAPGDARLVRAWLFNVAGPAPKSPPSPELIEKMRALGYVQ